MYQVQQEPIRELVGCGVLAVKVLTAVCLWAAFNRLSNRLIGEQLLKERKVTRLSVSELMLCRIETGISLGSLTLLVLLLVR